MAVEARASSPRGKPLRTVGLRLAAATLAVIALAASAACSGDRLPPTGTTPPPTPLSFAGIVDSIRRQTNLPALGAAIVTSDSVVQLAVSGTRRLGGTAAVTVNDRWHLGSVFKHQVSVLVAQLVANGTLSWSTTLAEHFPELATTMRAEYRTRTLRDLLSHSAGIARDWTSEVPRAGRQARAEAVRWALQSPPAATPGTYAYSNVGYMIAGAIVERALDRDFEQVVLERLWAALGMTSAGFGQAGSAGRDDEPLGHWLGSGSTPVIYDAGTPNADNPPEYSPAGRAHMSLRDWGRFTSALLAAERGRDTPVLSSAAWRALTRGYVANGAGSYGYGLAVADRSWASGRALFHDGTNTRHYALVGIAPERDFAILIATNEWSATMGATLDTIFARLASYQSTGR
ncbi:MAG: beta-lactamase family protein [Gemmatimonadaceae bacterium]|nr:beta-lactamase family protein [Gemmatimonadaceae bacterium]